MNKYHLSFALISSLSLIVNGCGSADSQSSNFSSGSGTVSTSTSSLTSNSQTVSTSSSSTTTQNQDPIKITLSAEKIGIVEDSIVSGISYSVIAPTGERINGITDKNGINIKFYVKQFLKIQMAVAKCLRNMAVLSM